jgi:chromosome segregation ATPase
LLFKQGWMGLPLFFIGLVSLAFSQFENQADAETLTSDQLAEDIRNLISSNEAALNNLTGVGRELDQRQSQFDDTIVKSLKKGTITENESNQLRGNFQSASSRFAERMDSTNETFSVSQNRLQDAKEIFLDLQQNFAGRLDEAHSPLLVLRENLLKTDLEINALSKMVDGVIEDFVFETDNILSKLEHTPSIALPPSNEPKTREINIVKRSDQAPSAQPTTSIGRRIAAVIQADQPMAFGSSFSEKADLSSIDGNKQNSAKFSLDGGNLSADDTILMLRQELVNSRNLQSELSVDSASLKADLRKAYREIVALQNNLTESQAIINELEESKQSFYKNDDGSRATAQMVSQRIKRLESDLETAKSELSQARQSLLLEQQRSNAMISSITTELERTRKELDFARQAVQGNGVNFSQLSMLERELAQAKQALRNAQNRAVEPDSSDYAKLQEELRKSLAEIARMQLELAESETLQDELESLKVTMSESDSSSQDDGGRISAKYVKKLLVELGEAKEEVARLKEGSVSERGNLSKTVDELEKKLRKSTAELDAARKEINSNRESLAKRELEFANTIKILEEEAEIAQAVLEQAADGKISAAPFISEMEDDLAASESRIRLLSDQFAQEQTKATEVIEGLQRELELANTRQKKSLDQIERRELELTGKSKELESLNFRKKELEEELQVVKVIAGQLQDLNKVLEETKEAQTSQNQTSDQVVDSLRNELNKAKVELVVALEDKEKLQKDFSDKIFSLERQLDDSRNEMIEEQELFYESAEESKSLLEELRNELKNAKNQVAKMKASGFTESVETKQAVSQLEEALGTIRILKESLEEAEKTNLELDNLRAELADSMSTHLQELQGAENEKLSLSQKVNDLETEIAVLREHSATTGVAHLGKNDLLNNQVAASSIQNKDLLRKLAEVESTGIASLVELEDEIAGLRGVNADLRDQISEIRSSNDQQRINELESELAQAKWKLESVSNKETVGVQNSEDSGSSDDLEDELNRALAKIKLLESKIQEGTDVVVQDLISGLENDLLEAEQTIENLQADVDRKQDSQAQLTSKLESAFSRIKALESKSNPESNISANELEELEQELAQSKIKILELGEEISLLSQLHDESSSNQFPSDTKVTDLQSEIVSLREELILSQEIISSLPSEDELLAMQLEIETLREELSSKDSSGGENDDIGGTSEKEILQDQLKTAIAESFDLQMELERTLDKLAELEALVEANSGSNPSSLSQEDAQDRINQLVLALKNSEQLREETENLVVELEKRVSTNEPTDFSDNPQFLELQEEMLALQNELLMLQDFNDPRLKDLEKSLDQSIEDSKYLEEELRNTKSELDRLALRANSLNEENLRLRNLASSREDLKNDSSVSLLNARISNLESENSSLLTQLAEKEKRISGLRQEMDSTVTPGNDKLLLAQVDDLRSKLRQAKATEERYVAENQVIRDELNQVRNKLRDSQGFSKSSDSLVSQELNRVRVENENLKNQLDQLSNLPNRDRIDEQIRELSQSNMNAQVMLDQERAVVEELKRQLADAREIKQEVLERGKSSKLKIDLLNDELSDARFRIDSLEKALVSARNAIRVLQDGGSVSSMIPVSTPLGTSYSSNLNRYRSGSTNRMAPSSSSRFAQSPSTMFIPDSKDLPTIKNTAAGNANLRVQANVKFLDNKVRPAAFTEFFVVEDDLQTILSAENIRLPRSEGIQSFAEFWARSVQRGYKFPGAAAKIRNALARASLRRIKTNSLGEGNLNNLPSGKYYLVGTSPLGQVGVVWSKSISLNNGDNLIGLNLADAAWAQ